MRPHTDARERDGPTRDANARYTRVLAGKTPRESRRGVSRSSDVRDTASSTGTFCTMSTLDDATLSKNARKRIARAAQREKRRAERKESERAAKRALAEKIKTEFHEKVNAMTREEREAFFAERAANLQAKRERDVAKKEAKARQLSSTHEILIDCEFGDLMSKPKEWSPLRNSCASCTSAIRRRRRRLN